MASSSSITREEFLMFHSIDRELYARLVVNLGRDTAQSMQVMALWLWLEQTGHGDNLVVNILAKSDPVVNAIAEETVTCLNCCHNMPLISSGANPIPLLQVLTKGTVSLRFFEDNRTAVISGVARVVDEVCVRAFEDIVRQIVPNNEGNVVAGEGIFRPAPVPEMGNTMSMNLATLHPQMFDSLPPLLPQPTAAHLYYSGIGSGTDMGTSSGATPLQNLSNELSQRLSLIDVHASEVKPIPQSERTIFLTFSKGFPISENEVKDFFTRQYGDFIEAIHMQEVNDASEQPLYARLVARSPSIIEQVLLEGNSKAKFSINGKHVWARKFVGRSSTTSSPKQSTPPSSPSASPRPTKN